MIEAPARLARVAVRSGAAIERIEQGAVVLASQTQRCTVRLRGAAVERELRAINVEDVRGALRARTDTRAPLVTRSSTPGDRG